MKSYAWIIWSVPLMLYAADTPKPNLIPYNTKGNSIVLTVENSAGIIAKNVRVEVDNPPKWMKFDTTSVQLSDIQSKKTKDAEFGFSVLRGAPVGKEQKLTFKITTTDAVLLKKTKDQPGKGASNPAVQSWSKDVSVTVDAPKEFRLYSNYPNPFNPSTSIAFEIPKPSQVKVVIYDLLGRIVKNLADEQKDAGYIEYLWDGRNNHGTMVSSGIYFYRVEAGSWHGVKKMVMAK